MSLGGDDLVFRMSIDPDTSKMEAAVKDIGADIDAQAKQAKKSWNAFFASGEDQLDKIQAHNKFANAFKAPAIPDLLNVRADQLKVVTGEMSKQKDLLERINVELNPGVLRERVALEKELTDARAKYKAAHEFESARQNPQEVLPVGGLKELLGHALNGRLNLRQLAGSAIGGAVGGGTRGALGAVAGGVGGEAISGALGPMGVAAAAAVGSVLLLKDALKSLVGTVANLAGVASPASLKQWELAVRDLHGVIGQTLVPVLNLFRDSLRLLADVLANILPNTREMEEALAPLAQAMREFGDEARRILGIIGPLIRNVLVGALYQATTELSLFIGQLEILVKFLRYTTALALFSGNSRSSVGAAARPGRISTGEDYQKLNIESALSSFGGQTIPQKQLTTLEQIRDILARKQTSTVNQPIIGRQVDPHGINRALGIR